MEAELLAAPHILSWKKLIKEAKTDGVAAKAKALRQAFLSDKDNDKLDEDGAMEVVRDIIIEEAIGGIWRLIRLFIFKR